MITHGKVKLHAYLTSAISNDKYEILCDVFEARKRTQGQLSDLLTEKTT